MMRFLGTAIDAFMVGVIGGLLFWLLWGTTGNVALLAGALGGSLTACLMRVSRNVTPGDQLAQKLSRSGNRRSR